MMEPSRFDSKNTEQVLIEFRLNNRSHRENTRWPFAVPLPTFTVSAWIRGNEVAQADFRLPYFADYIPHATARIISPCTNPQIGSLNYSTKLGVTPCGR